MTRTRTRILLTAAFVAAALGLSVLVPSEEFQQGPYVQSLRALDTQAVSREFAVTVTDARLADRVQAPDWTGTTDGVWLVVDIEFERTLTRGSITGSFRIGETEYLASERPDLAAIDSASSLPGLAWAGSLLVELPLSALDDPAASAAVLRFSTQDDPRLDGVVDVTLDLGTLDHESSITVFDPAQVPA
jgi:hypothetical protein